MERTICIVLGLLTSGCAVPSQYANDHVQFCAIDGNRFCEVRERETGSADVDVIAPCPKIHKTSSHRTLYMVTHDLAAAGLPPAVSSPAVAFDQDMIPDGDARSFTRLARSWFKLPASVSLMFNDDPRVVEFNPRTLDGPEAASLHSLGFARPEGAACRAYRWDGADGRWYLVADDEGVHLFCPRAGLVRRRTIAWTIDRIWDPASHRVAFVETDATGESPASVTVWDYFTDRTTRHRLRSPGR